MATEIELKFIAPVELQAVQEGLAVGPPGPQGPAWTGDFGAKYSSIDAGTLWDMSIDDDYLYICVKTGTAGNAIWKKTVLFAT